MLTPKQEAKTKWDMDRIVVFDIESYEWTNPIAIGLYDGKKYQSFTGKDCINEFIEEILRRKYRNTIFVAHNGGRYDFGFILQEIIERDLDINFLDQNGSIFYIKLYDKNGKPRQFQDSFKILPESLDSLAKDFTDKKKGGVDFDKLDKWNNLSKSKQNELLKYLKMDNVILYEVLEKYTKIVHDLSNGKVGPQLTVGSTTMDMFRVGYMENPIPHSFKPDPNLDYQENVNNYEDSAEYDIRKAYYGGRTEVFKRKGKHLFHYDINSLYPYVFTNKRIPIGKPYETDKDITKFKDIGGLVKLEGKIKPTVKYPVLPTVANLNEFDSEKIIFPTGKIEGWYPVEEVRFAKQMNQFSWYDIKKAYASSYGKPFEKYGNRLYKLKKSIDKHENPAKYRVVKFLLNSFYGKFALKRKQTKYANDWKENDTIKIISPHLEKLGIMGKDTISRAKYIIPRISVAIASYARIELFKWFDKTHERGGKIYYCDTDSIVTDVKIPTGKEMGEMDLEGRIEKAYFLAPKVYAEKLENGETTAKAKGMKNISSFENFEKSVKENRPEIINSEWESPQSPLVGLKQDGKIDKENRSRSLTKFDTKRIHENNYSYPIQI